MKICSMIIFFLALGPGAFATKIVGNGGDFYALEFISIGQRILQFLEKSPVNEVDLKKLSRILDETDVESTHRQLQVDGKPKDAINYPALKKIVFNRKRWAQAESRQKPSLVLHEYLGIMGVDDTGYKLSKALTNGIEDGTFDRKLTKEEMERLLPKYVAFIKRNASQFPTSYEFGVLGGMAYDSTNLTHVVVQNGEIVGFTSPQITAQIKAIEKTVLLLKKTTDKDREESALDLMSGFAGSSASGKISCLLGYRDESKAPHERIVKCMDDRSEDANEDGEGSVDIRTFILSIDSKFLEPVGFVRLFHSLAG